MSRGGNRPGARRPPGSRNQWTRELDAMAASEGLTPLGAMLKAMHLAASEGRWDEAGQIAKRAAPYVHPRLSPIHPRSVQRQDPQRHAMQEAAHGRQDEVPPLTEPSWPGEADDDWAEIDRKIEEWWRDLDVILGWPPDWSEEEATNGQMSPSPGPLNVTAPRARVRAREAGSLIACQEMLRSRQTSTDAVGQFRTQTDRIGLHRTDFARTSLL